MTYTVDHENFASYASYDAPKRNVIMNFGSLRRDFSALFEAMRSRGGGKPRRKFPDMSLYAAAG